jgi:hypothetical protein
MDIFAFIRAEDQRLVKLMDKLGPKDLPADVEDMLIRQAGIQFGALSRVEGEHFYPAFEVYEQTADAAAMHMDMIRGISAAFEAIEGAEPGTGKARAIDTLREKVEAYVTSKESALVPMVRAVIPGDLAQGLGRAAQEDMNVHRRKIANGD